MKRFLIFINIFSFIGSTTYKSLPFHNELILMGDKGQEFSIDLSAHLDVDPKHYAAILQHLEEDIVINDRLEASFHFIKYHDCIDQESRLLQILTGYLVQYCFDKQRYTGATTFDIQQLFIEGRNKFFNAKDSATRSGASRSGELGEIALYFLLESYLKCPQIVSKMSLKTTAGENYKGSDGVHVGLVDGKKCFFYCESKLNKVRDNAFGEAIKSVIAFHLEKKNFEISVVNNHLNIAEGEFRQAVLDFINPTVAKGDDWLEVNACFIGYNWDKFPVIEKEQPNDVLMKKLAEELQSEVTNIKKYIADNIKYPEVRHRFFFFVIPFKDVENMRKNFLELLYGTK